MTRKAKYSKLLPIEVADSKQPLQKAIVNLDDVTIIISKVSFHACLFLFFFPDFVVNFREKFCMFL